MGREHEYAELLRYTHIEDLYVWCYLPSSVFHMALQRAKFWRICIIFTYSACVRCHVTPLPFPSQVVIGAHAMLSDGSIVADAGVYPLVLAAHAHSVPVIVVANVLKVGLLDVDADDAAALRFLTVPLCNAGVS